MIKGERVRMLYVLSLCFDHVVSLTVGKNEKIMLWHGRLSHLSESGTGILNFKNVLIYTKDANFDLCEDCLYDGKELVL